MLSHEQEFVLQAMNDFCHGKNTDRPEQNIDMEQVFEYAKEHSLAGLLYTQCSKWLVFNTSYRQYLIQDMYASANRQQLFKEITEEFEKEKISFICMKGSVFRDCYPYPETRSMGDIDIIIHTDDRQKTDEIFVQKLGYTKYVDNHAVWTYSLRDFHFEVHDHMFYEYLANRFDYRGYFDDIWNHVHNKMVFDTKSEYLYVPDEEYHFLYLMTHTAKHIINNGCGFRAYLDMVRITGHADLNWNFIKQELERLELLDFTKTCFALCERWFGVAMPIEHEPLDESFFMHITEKTFHDGVFGLHNKENEGAHTAKEVKKDNDRYWFTVFRLTVTRLFPPYRDLQLIPWYSFIDGKPWLLPFVWIYRWFYCAVHKLRPSLKRLSEPYRFTEKIKKRESLIRDWGL